MDRKQLIILIGMIVLYLISSIKKAKSKKQTMQIPEVDTFDESEEVEEPSFSELQNEYKKTKNAKNHPRNSDFGQSRYQTLESLETDYNPQINPLIELQRVENEDYRTIDISMEIDDVKKGFIYSEILKNKYN